MCVSNKLIFISNILIKVIKLYLIMIEKKKITQILQKIFCIPITFNNPLKVCFSNKKYPITIQTRPTQIVKVYFLLKDGF